MAKMVQQLTWELSKADLEELLQQAGPDYSALQFKICIDDAGTTKYLVSLVKAKAEKAAEKTTAFVESVGKAVLEKEACPVPPGCK